MNPEKKPVNFLFLYTRFPDYFLQCVIYLLDFCPGSKAWVVEYEPDKDAPYAFTTTDPRIEFIKRSSLEEAMIDEIIKPDVIYVAGWGDKLYNRIGKKNKHRIPVIIGLDNPWTGNWRQRVATVLSPFLIRSICNFIWVTGTPQYEYARRLGFLPSSIIKGLYCAKPHEEHEEEAKLSNKNRIIFVGRLVSYKRPDWLTKAFVDIIQHNPELNNWKLTLIGQGPMKEALHEQCKKYQQVEFIDFMQPAEVKKYYPQAAIFCLPSHHEHWGVVVQEAAAAGLPLLLSDTCGAASEFLVNGYNGYIFNSLQYEDFKEKLLLLMTRTNNERSLMGAASRMLSGRITHELWAASFKSVLVNGKS